jgi:hypothetical protein
MNVLKWVSTRINPRSPQILGVMVMATSVLGLALGGGTIALAVDRPMSYVMDATGDSSFGSLNARAEAMATDLINRAFAANPSLTTVSLSISADRFGNILPLFFVRVSREQWQRQARVQAWAKYPSNASILLGFEKLSPAATASAFQDPSPRAFNPNSEPNFYN